MGGSERQEEARGAPTEAPVGATERVPLHDGERGEQAT